MVESTITPREILEKFKPRKKSLKEASFFMALLPTIASLCVGLMLQRFIGIYAGIQNAGYVLIVPAFMLGSIFKQAVESREKTIHAIQDMKGYADCLKAIFKNNSKLQEKFIVMVDIICTNLRGEDPSRSPRKATTELCEAFGPYEANQGSSLSLFIQCYGRIGSRKLKEMPKGVRNSMGVFWLVITVIAFVTPENGDFSWVVAFIYLAVIYGFSITYFLSKNMLNVFGTRGSQYRTSELAKELMANIEEPKSKG